MDFSAEISDFLWGVMDYLRRDGERKMCLQGYVFQLERQSVWRKADISEWIVDSRSTQCDNIISELKQIYSMTMEMFVVEFGCLTGKFFSLFSLLWKEKELKAIQASKHLSDCCR